MAISRSSAFALLAFLLVLPTEHGLEDGVAVGAVDDPELISSQVAMQIKNSTARLSEDDSSTCGTGNPVDDCWRCDPKWHRHRKNLAECGIGFGRNAIGGRKGRLYHVTDPSDDDPVNPRPGTLRYGVIQDEPLWIVFQGDMVITLSQELIVNSFKTIDGRGADVHIANGACITIQFVTNIIIHGLHIHDCKPTGNAMVRSSPSHYGWRTIADGDGISIFGSSHIWVDHNSLSNCTDGLIDAIIGSTSITISNNYFTNHNEVMLLGHSDSYKKDKVMQVTIAFNHFGEGLIQRMPRCRHGYFHVVNNDYTHWEMYAIGGSANPTINSQGNRYLAPKNPFAKEVTKRVGTPKEEWKEWNWRSEGDLLENGAYFTPSGAASTSSYSKASSLGAKSSSIIDSLTAGAGALKCRKGYAC
ncbi:probable pectate lyase 1 [Zingiber officinale]|uniref:probable pectate lyase 1 n=1 Tax=Zingiber officinale TaxID=94328 RepID=UPI001C4A8A70|nr:probable pectate lyase 1 [Zingiber officinale]